MDSIFRGELVSSKDFLSRMNELNQFIKRDLLVPLLPEVVINSVDQLIRGLNIENQLIELCELGIPKWAAEDYLNTVITGFTKAELTKRVNKELGNNPFEWKRINEEIEEKTYPLGVLMHIGAGNALGLSALSVLEGLLTGNINILKLPKHEGGISVKLLMRLIDIEPRLKPYIYCIHISSKEKVVIDQLIQIVNGVVVWGGDEAIKAIRQITPPTIALIEWGHRLSFAYFTRQDDRDLELLAKEIVLTDQLYCSSPQCVFYETEDRKELEAFSDRLAHHLENYSYKYPITNRPMDVQSQITWTHEFIKAEEIFSTKKLYTNQNKTFGVVVDDQTSLKPSPLFRNIWVMPIRRNEIMSLLHPHKGHLQTVALSCNSMEFNELSELIYRAGVNRIMACGKMSSNYSGEPHDGAFALQRYIRIVNRRWKED